MKKKIFLIIAGMGLLFSVRAGDGRFQLVENDSPVQTDSQSYVPNMLLAKPKLRLLNLASMQGDLLRQFPRQIKSAYYEDRVGYEVIELAPGQSAEEAKSQLQKSGVFSEVSFNYTVRITETIPNDEYFKYQYSLKNTGQFVDTNKTYSGATGADIKATDGWDWATGSDSVVIAVIDTGVAIGHEDLQSKIVSGYNFIDSNTQIQDDNGHGTFVASVAAAETNNSKGMAGICWKAKIMPLKAMNSKGDGDYLQLALAIRYAAEHGAKVINMSLGGKNDTPILKEACQQAVSKGCVLVASTGNDHAQVLFPAAYDDYCLAVGATDANDQVALFSNFGPEVDVVAPGVWMVGALFNPKDPTDLRHYAYGDGTSYAAPVVSGAAALLLSYKPNLTPAQVMNLIRYTADDVNKTTYPGKDVYMGYGRINLKTLLSPYILQ